MDSKIAFVVIFSLIDLIAARHMQRIPRTMVFFIEFVLAYVILEAATYGLARIGLYPGMY
jgi:hypothetical protein